MTMFKEMANLFTAISGNLFVTFSRIEIDAESPDQLVLDVNTRRIVANRTTRQVSSEGKLLARFEAIQSIDVEHIRNGKRFEWWVVNLHLLGGRNVRIGKTVDGTQSSIAAAHLSTITGKNVRALSRWSAW